MIPQEMRDRPQWVAARVTQPPGGRKKVLPINPRNLRAASPTDSRTWAPFELACKVAKEGKLHIMYGFTKDDPFIGFDLDEPRGAAECANHDRIYNSVVSYTERSISGKGVHIIVRGAIPHALKRDHVEMYDHARFFIMTGDHIAGRPTTIEDCDAIANEILAQADSGRVVAIEYSEPEKESDRAVYDKCLSYANGERFKDLWDGRWQTLHSSQSEADFALINMLAFVSYNNEQTKRLFRTSNLGQRKKATREDYLDGMIGRIRGEQNQQVDFSQFQPPAMIEPPEEIKTDFKFPGGLVGEMAKYIFATAIKPIAEIALAGSLGLMSGMTGRTYNISNTGLNLYYLIIAETAIGKEGAKQGMDRIMKAVSKTLPAAGQFIGPSRFASGQALVKRLESTPCMVSKLSEFGHVLKKICHPNAIGSDIMWRELFLELFNSSGPTDKLGEMVYSDTGKNTAAIESPAFSIVADATAVSVFENLSEATIEMGLIPRFTLIECTDERPPTNPNAFQPPGAALVSKVEQLAIRCMSMSANNTRQPITLDPEARAMMDAFDKEIDGLINAQKDDVTRQIWSRSYMKAMRLAGIVAVGMDLDNPCVTRVEAEWGIEFARVDARHMLKHFGDGVGGGDPEQIARLRTIICNTLRAKKTPRKMKQMSVVSHGLISPRAYATACFKEDRMGAGNALARALRALMDNGEIIELSSKDTVEYFKTTARCYAVTKSFLSR